ncbi:DUF2833 domain-containing protein [Pseudomonas protegens]|uniref:DUF2833 domain-containing protein n=1 Tax=Pseudomonas protegens TaxID=380021 RepID=A0A7G8YE28_9PSED|nr:phage protein Gp13 family protein [Pseudomonas protegens]QNH79695.1 DUF2833 domain-containing protein [Pseudomonas protegens]QNL03122.1 DUF2833 domain-containing protein [Pseudomonas protegens]
MFKVKATQGDLLEAAKNLSRGDLKEFHSLQSGRDPLDVFPSYLDETTNVIKSGGVVLAVGGHAKGAIWFVTTNVVDSLSVAERFRFYRILKDHLKSIQTDTKGLVLTNVVSLENRAHIRLLRSLGATFHSDYVLSPAGFKFRQFWL